MRTKLSTKCRRFCNLKETLIEHFNYVITYCFLDHNYQPSESLTKPFDYEQNTSIIRVRSPFSNKMVLTETFIQIREKIKNEATVILQCYGVPGSGKSETIRKLAEEFPFENSSQEVLVKWHIQCKDSGHNLQEQLKNLTDKLLKHSMITDSEQHSDIVVNLKTNDSIEFVDALVKLEIPILILVEDPLEEQVPLLRDVSTNLKRNAEKRKKISQKIHLYISSRKNIALLEVGSDINCYKSEKIEGFNEDEALSFLNQGLPESDNKDKLEIFQIFSGLPLGLNTAKTFCKKARINYRKYLELVKDVEYDIISKEKEAILEEYGCATQHIFQAIVIPFEPVVTPLVPTKKNDISAILIWKILCCLSYLHYDRIPRYVLEHFCHVLRDKKVKNPVLKNEVEIGSLISDLLDHSMCTETNKDEITFHEVVLNAFRLNRLNVLKTDFNPLKNSIKNLCRLVSKDMRKKEHSLKMFKLRRHLQTLLGHVENNQHMFEDQHNEQLLRALTSYLYETTAAIMLSESPSTFWNESEKHFEKALRVIFPSDDVIEDIMVPKTNQEAKDIAFTILEISKQKGANLPSNFTIEYASNLQLSFEEQTEELDFLRSQTKNSSLFAETEKLLSAKDSTEIIIDNFQQCGLFLSDEKYRPIFYAERFAFILHSWSRLVLYGDQEDVKKIEKRCLWMSELCNEISIACKEQCEVSLLSEPLSTTGGFIPILLKVKESDEKVRKAWSICEENLQNQENTEMFENGLLKEVYGPSATDNRISLLRYIVRINTHRYEKICSDSDSIIKADKRCKELFELSVKHSETISICSMCFIYCAKYHAAKEEMNESLKCFGKFFELGFNSDSRFHVRCWAVYNYARAVIKFENCQPEYLVDAFNKCDEMLNLKNVGEMKSALKEHLISCKNVLDQKVKSLKKRENKFEEETATTSK